MTLRGLNRDGVARGWPWLVGAAATAFYLLLALLRFHRFVVSSWDNAIFEQAIAAYSRFQAPIVPIKGPGYNILGDHFSPIDALIAPFYRLFPHPQTLLVAQAMLVGASVVIIGRAAQRHLPTAQAVTVALLYASSFGVLNAVGVDFHEMAFSAPIMAMVGLSWLDERYDRVVWWSLPLLLVKEDLGLTVAAIGAVLMLRRGERVRGALLAVGGVVALVLIVWVIIPAFNTAGHYDYTGNLGGHAGVIETLFTSRGTKALTLLVTVGITGFAALLSPWTLVALPTLAWRFTGTVDYYWGTTWHYSLVLMPVVFIALIDALRRRPVVAWPALVIAALFCGAQLPGSQAHWLTTSDAWHATVEDKAAAEAVRQVPKGVTVEADIGLLTHLANDRTAYFVGTVGSAQPDWVVLDNRFSQQDALTYAQTTHGGNWELVWSGGPFTIAKRL